MILFSASATACGELINVAEAESGEILTSRQTLLAAVSGPAAVSSTLAEIDEVVRSEDPDDRPTDSAKTRTIALIADAQNVAPIYIAASDIEGFERNLFVHWTVGDKRLVLIAPPSADSPLEIYRKKSDGWSELLRDPRPLELSAALNWVLQQ